MLVIYDGNKPVGHAQTTPTWREVHRFWLTLMEVYAADCARVGVDNLDPSDLRYRRGYIGSFMSQLINARTPQEREAILAEATQFLEQQEQKARPTPAPMKTVNAKPRPALR